MYKTLKRFYTRKKLYTIFFSLLPLNIKHLMKVLNGVKQNNMDAFDLIKYLTEGKLYEAAMACPLPTQDLELNTKNRDSSIKADYIKYGPLNVDEPGDFWDELAEHWDTTVEAAKQSLCANCAAFDISPRMEDCMPGPLSDDDGKLGYCWMHNFKCHSARTCRTWAKGGPIVKDSISYEWQTLKEND